MAFNDTLFQLGMDLTRSSTAQKEDRSRVESDAEAAVRECDAAPQMSTTLAGSPLSIDLHGAKRLADVKSAERALRHAIESLGLKLKAVHLSCNVSGGVSGEAVLAKGLFMLNSCSRPGLATIDARGCSGLKPEAALIAFANAFGAREAVIRKARKEAAIQFPGTRAAQPAAVARPRRIRGQAKAA